MFQFRKISGHIQKNKLSFLILLSLILLGFLAGCLYTNLISDSEFFSAGAQAEEFIKKAKENELSFPLMLSEELSVYLLIALFSLFLFGMIPTVFLVFKQGFSLGFFLTFLVKCFSMKGFFLGGMFLLLHLVTFLPSLLLLANKSLALNRFLVACTLHKSVSGQTVFGELFGILTVSLVCILTVSLGVSFKCLLLPPLCNYLFM